VSTCLKRHLLSTVAVQNAIIVLFRENIFVYPFPPQKGFFGSENSILASYSPKKKSFSGPPPLAISMTFLEEDTVGFWN